MTPSEALAHAKSINKNARAKAERAEQGIVRKAVVAGTGAAIAYAEKKGMPDEMLGVPSKLAVGVGLTLVEIFAKGAVQRIAGAVSDASLAVWSHEAVQEGSFVAGDGSSL